MATHKEFAILEHQMFEAEITGSTFSKIEYDRETTNEINEINAMGAVIPRYVIISP